MTQVTATNCSFCSQFLPLLDLLDLDLELSLLELELDLDLRLLLSRLVLDLD